MRMPAQCRVLTDSVYSTGMHTCAQVARGEKRPADGDYGAPTARRHCSGARGGDSDEVNGSYEVG
eukprot:COSAG02_NODE_1535_length_12053_cov_13.122794_13_plen_65_part_00